ncbi:uncharacterized protein LOC131883187 [Tigriopus californicus]|nr:uncharacterized protein LOC131883187 [Tigriopus californicus]
MVDSSLMRETRPSSLRGSSAWISSEDLLTDGSSTDDDGDGACREDLSHLAERNAELFAIADNKMIWRLPNVFKSPIQCEPEIRKAGLLEVSSKVPQDLQNLSFTQHETTTPSLLAHSVEPEICWKPKRGSSFKAHQDLARKVLQYEAFVDRSQEDEKKL